MYNWAAKMSMSQTHPKRVAVLIVDDHPAIRVGLTSMLETQTGIEVTAAVGSGPDALACLVVRSPDIILVDLRMAGMSGIELIRDVRLKHPNINLIALTSYGTDEDIYAAVRAGVRGFLLKDAARDELIDAIFAVQAGNCYFPPQIASRLADRLQRPSLSRRELEVLDLLSKGLTNNQIAKALFISGHTVRCHVASISEKLNVSDRTEAVTVAIKTGMIQL
jgi:two-component system, NarL family, response regulator